MRLSKPTLATNPSIVLMSGCHDNRFLRPTAAVGEEMGARRGRTDAVLDRESPVALYYQLAQNMETAIRQGRLSSGSHLENEIELARQLRVSRPTVRRAIALLANRGLVIRRHGIGTLVVPVRVRRPVRLSSLYDDLQEARSEEHTSELQSQSNLVCRLLLEKKKTRRRVPPRPLPGRARPPTAPNPGPSASLYPIPQRPCYPSLPSTPIIPDRSITHQSTHASRSPCVAGATLYCPH